MYINNSKRSNADSMSKISPAPLNHKLSQNSQESRVSPVQPSSNHPRHSTNHKRLVQVTIPSSPTPSLSIPQPPITQNPTTTAASLYDGVKAKLQSMSMELEDKSKTIELLQEKMKREKIRYESMIQSMKKDHDVDMKVLKKTYEKTLDDKRTMLEQLINDKKDLTEQVDKLVNQMKSTEGRKQSTFESQKKYLQDEFKRAKEKWAKEEKEKRKKWEEEKTESLKKDMMSVFLIFILI